MNPSAGLMGASLIQEAQVNQWVAWADCLASTVSAVTNAHGKNVDGDINKLKGQVKDLNTHLKDKTWIVGNRVTVADLICGWTLAKVQVCFDAQFRKANTNLC